MAELESTRELILESALSILNKYGYGGLSLSALAADVGMTKQRVHYHFPDISEIVLILAERWSQTGQQIAMECLADTHETGEMKVLAMAEGMFKWIAAYPELSRLGLVLFQSAPHIKGLGRFMDQARAVARARIEGFLLSNPKLKKLKESRLEAIVTDLHSQMYGYGFYVIIMNDVKQVDHYREICLSGLKNSLRAIV